MLEGASETDWKERNSKEQARSQFSRAGERDTRATQVVYGDGKIRWRIAEMLTAENGAGMGVKWMGKTRVNKN